MMYISYSLWGSNKVYTYGLVENVLRNKKILPAWKVRVHHNDTVPENVLTWLKQQDNVELVHHEGSECKASNMFWRFEDLFLPDTTVLIRDADSRISDRELGFIQEWLDSDRDFHFIRDAETHKVCIPGGLLGCRNNCLRYIAGSSGLRNVNLPPLQFHDGLSFMRQFYQNLPAPRDHYNMDQIFLYTYVYPQVVHQSMVHCSYNAYEPFARKVDPVDTGFCGEIEKHCPEATKIFEGEGAESTFERVAAY